MNLEDSNSFREKIQRTDRNKKGIILSIILCAILIALLLMMIIVIKYEDSKTLKMYLDGTLVGIPSNFYKDIDGKRYINIKDLSSMLGYRYTRGEYGKYNENYDSCYVQNDFEILAVTAGENTYSKYLQMDGELKLADVEVKAKNKNGYSENFEIEDKIQFIDDTIYIPLENISDMFNIKVDWQEFRIKFYSLNYLVNNAKNKVTKYGIAQMSGLYENFRALVDGYAIVGNGDKESTSTQYGVISINDGKEIISVKYKDIVYIQNSKEFYITVDNDTVGILNSEGGTVIAPTEFEEISLIDNENNLYLVRKNDQYGILDKYGKTLIYAENDEIGLDTKDFPLDNSEKNYVFFGKCIPALKGFYYGLYNTSGKLALQFNYDGLGCKLTTTKNGREQSVLLIPSSVGINGIVVSLNSLYGIYDVNREKLIFPCNAEKIYAITESGKTKYYATYQGEEIDLEEWIEQNNYKNVDENGNVLKEDNSDENESINENATTEENIVNENTTTQNEIVNE